MSTEVMERPVVEITTDQVDLIKNTVANGATKDELNLFLYDCKRRGVHPLDRLIHFTVRTDTSGKRRYTPIVGIDFMRMQAAQTGEHIGTSLPLYGGEVGKDGFHCTVVVKRLVQGLQSEFGATVYWEEFYPGDKLGFMWKKMPRVMLAKVAESHALRKGFPSELSGLYTTEEMEQSSPPQADHLSKAMTQGFPPDTDNEGVLVEIRPSLNNQPPKVMIQTLDGVLGLDVYGDEMRFHHLLGQEVIYRYTKDGAKRPIQSMVKRELAPPKPILVSPDPLPIPTKPAPKVSKTPVAQNWVRGRVLAVTPTDDPNARKWDFLLALRDGDFKASTFIKPKRLEVESYQAIVDTEIYFLSQKSGAYTNIIDLKTEAQYDQWALQRDLERKGGA